MGERDTNNFGKEHYGWGGHVSHDRVKKALHADGSLVMAADIDFFVPDDGALQAYYGDVATSDCSIQVGSPSLSSIHRAHSPPSRVFRLAT